MNTVYRITLDIHKVGSQAVIPVFQGDSGYTIIATLTENGKPYLVEENATAFFQGVKPKGTYLNNACTIENGTIVYDFFKTVENGETCQTTAEVGRVDCQFKLIGTNGAILASPKFDIVVSECIYNEQDIVESSSEYTALTEYVAVLNAKVNSGYFKGDQGEQGIQGEKGDQGAKGDTYTLTEADKQDVANLVLSNFTDVSEVGL